MSCQFITCPVRLQAEQRTKREVAGGVVVDRVPDRWTMPAQARSAFGTGGPGGPETACRRQPCEDRGRDQGNAAIFAALGLRKKPLRQAEGNHRRLGVACGETPLGRRRSPESVGLFGAIQSGAEHRTPRRAAPASLRRGAPLERGDFRRFWAAEKACRRPAHWSWQPVEYVSVTIFPEGGKMPAEAHFMGIRRVSGASGYVALKLQ